MKYCEKCGSQLRDDVSFCPGCGMGQGEHYRADSPQEGNSRGRLAEDRAAAAIAYLGPLAFVSLFLAKGSRLVRFHANQGIVLAMASVAYGIVSGILERVALIRFWRAYIIIGLIGIVWLVFPTLACIGIANAINGQEKELPVIGKIRLLR